MVKERENKLNQLLDAESENIDLTLSYSKLSDFDRNGPICLIRKKDVTGKALKHGSLVDDRLVDDRTGSNLFEQNYYKFDGEKPSATLGLLCDIIINNYEVVPKSTEEILVIIKHNGFWNNIKNEETLISKFNNDEFWNYINQMFESKGKILVTTSEYNKASEIIAILKTHPYSKDVIINNNENILQYSFNYDYKGFRIRGIIDFISIDHKNKLVYFTDLKTGADNALEFENSFLKWRYYFQGGLYTRAYNSICEELGLVGYALQPFQFLYISHSDKIPLLYIMTDKWLKASFKGFNIGKYVYKGIDELIDNIYWCWKNKEYNVPKDIIENNGIINLKDNYIDVNE